MDTLSKLNLVVVLAVKFRAFGITFGTVNQDWKIPLTVAVPLAVNQQLISFNKQGVTLTATFSDIVPLSQL